MAIFETKNFPTDSYIRKVPRCDIAKFTLVQLLLLATLYLVKSTAIGISFPLFIAVRLHQGGAILCWHRPSSVKAPEVNQNTVGRNDGAALA